MRQNQRYYTEERGRDDTGENICQTEEIIKMQMKEMNSEKEVGAISRNQKWKKAQKKKGGSDGRQRKENKKGSTQTINGKGCKFCG